jgi:hypothetical protein
MIHQPLIRKFLTRWQWVALGLILGLFGAFYFSKNAPNVDESAGVPKEKSHEDRQLLPDGKNALRKYEKIDELLAEANAAEMTFQTVRRRLSPEDPRWNKAKETFERTQDQALTEFHRIRQADFDQEYWEDNWEGIRADFEEVDNDRAVRFGLANRLVRARVATLQARMKDR